MLATKKNVKKRSRNRAWNVMNQAKMKAEVEGRRARGELRPQKRAAAIKLAKEQLAEAMAAEAKQQADKLAAEAKQQADKMEADAIAAIDAIAETDPAAATLVQHFLGELADAVADLNSGDAQDA